MTALATTSPSLPSMSARAVDKVRRLEDKLIDMPQVDIDTTHLIHGGLYARTVTIPAGVVLTGVLIRLDTVVIVNGHCTVFTGDHLQQIAGYHVLPAGAGRKQAFLAHTDTHVTMLFPSTARTVEEAENEFTDEAHKLLSRRNPKGE